LINCQVVYAQVVLAEHLTTLGAIDGRYQTRFGPESRQMMDSDPRLYKDDTSLLLLFCCQTIPQAETSPWRTVFLTTPLQP